MAARKANEIVVFSIVQESACGECGRELWNGDMLRKEGDRVLCLVCADLDHLVYLPRGDAALTRRANRLSKLRAVVVRFARARRRYERQGILVEESALAQAEQACLDDAAARERARERAAVRRARLDAEYVRAFAAALLARYPGCPKGEELVIAEHACMKYSDRIGRSAGAKRFDADALVLATRAHVRHECTEYDELLADGWDRGDARATVTPRVDDILDRWQRA